ncbi:hypothetical protein SAMD00019534_058870, partial [Acytostelium subglobosum LB1]|uniref:hypothetical protein n=1 Tax=Acytostelium subglobosum LB1 TaxID=1410327 RepID=UPI000644D753
TNQIHNIIMNTSTSSSSLNVELERPTQRDCYLSVKVFEARSLPDGRLRKKDSSARSGKSFKLAHNILSELSSPNLMNFSDTTDPYCIVHIGKDGQRTRTIPKKLNPFWCEEFHLEVMDPDIDKLLISVMDEKKYSNDEKIGRIVIPINTLIDQKERELWYPIQPPTGSKKLPQVQLNLTLKQVTIHDAAMPGYLSWKGMWPPHPYPSYPSFDHSLTRSINQIAICTNHIRGEIGSGLFINWNVRSKKGDIVIEQIDLPWDSVAKDGVRVELKEAIDTINVLLWRMESKQDQQVGSSSGSSSSSSSSSSTVPPPVIPTRSRSGTFITDHFTPSGQAKARSVSNSSLSYSPQHGHGHVNDHDSGGANIEEPVLIGVGTISAAYLDIDKPNDLWVTLYPRLSTENKLGDVRLKLKYSEEVVLPLQSYMPLLRLLQNERLTLVHILSNTSSNREQLASILIRVFEKSDRCVSLITSLTDKEIEITDNPDIIFRGNSLATKSLDLYMKLIGLKYLAGTVGPLVKKIVKANKSCEIDPTKMAKGEDVKKNGKTLLKYVREMSRAIFASIDRCPKPMRQIFSAIQSKVRLRYPSDEITKYTAVGGFIFLRLMCPAIMAPKLFGLTLDHPNIKTTRTLILVAKSLQNLANLVEFSDYKEDFMKDMNLFVADNIGTMKTFINTLSTVPVDNCPPGELASPIVLEKELASLHRLLAKHQDEMRAACHQTSTEEVESLMILDKVLKILDEEISEL